MTWWGKLEPYTTYSFQTVKYGSIALFQTYGPQNLFEKF